MPVSKTPFRKTTAAKNFQRVETRWLRLRKRMYWSIRSRPTSKDLVFIVGCQRSGTTLLGRLFDKDWRTTVLQEDSPLTGNEESRLRLKPLSHIPELLDQFVTPLIVAKPLVESQHTDRLVEEVPRSYAIWMFRDFRDVVQSHLKKFQGQRSHVRKMCKPEGPDWRSERLSAELRDLLSRFYSDEMSRPNAAALIWYARNSLLYELQLETHPRVTMCRYESLVANPSEEMHRMCTFLGYAPPKSKRLDADSRSVGLGGNLEIDTEVVDLCERLQQRLITSFANACPATSRETQV